MLMRSVNAEGVDQAAGAKRGPPALRPHDPGRRPGRRQPPGRNPQPQRQVPHRGHHEAAQQTAQDRRRVPLVVAAGDDGLLPGGHGLGGLADAGKENECLK